ncbi:unnamed protein product [Symbiodinium pilosum]|uniref:Uncharacterized protein n=1 Tax=Symbiodinium pilosum TaxID=2952 RepID=A0A812J3D6_SYMPI|nr:unnamed protein product [Symbiodinium pilosum]
MLQSYVSVLAHLAYVFKHHKKDRESAKVHQWIYLGLASWAARITVAALVDVLGLAYHAKNQLENVTSIERVAEIAQQLRASLASYTEKNSALANAMVGGNAVAKTYEAEKVCRLWREQQNSKILVRYETKDGDIVEEGIRFAGFEDVQHILRTFQRVRDYARACGDKVLARFGASSILEPAVIFNATYELEQSSFADAVSRMSDI